MLTASGNLFLGNDQKWIVSVSVRNGKRESTLCLIDIDSSKIDYTQKVLSSLKSSIADLRKDIFKTFQKQMITGAYIHVLTMVKKLHL